MTLINTRIQNIRAESNIDKYELRASRYGALSAFMMQTDDPAGIITQELKAKAVASIGNVVETPVIDYDSGVTISNVRNAVIADDENTSQMYAITFATYAWGFTMVPAMYSNNEISLQKDFTRKMRKYETKFAETLDTNGVAALAANKTTVFNELLGLYTNLGNTVNAKYSEREAIIGDINPMQAANDFYDQLSVVGNTGTESLVRKLSEKGLYNEADKQYQFSDKIWHFSNRVPNQVGRYATGYAINAGSIGMLTRFERESILGTQARTGHEWGISALPMTGINVGTYYYESVGDYSGIAGAATADMTRARKEHYGFAVDVAFVVPYNSDSNTIPSPIMKFEVNTAATDADTTAPEVSTVVSAALTAAVVTFDEVMCSDANGTILSGDIAADITLTGSTTATVTSAIVADDGKSITFVFVAGDLAATDNITLDNQIYDGNGNLLASLDIAVVNAGATAWEKI